LLYATTANPASQLLHVVLVICIGISNLVRRRLLLLPHLSLNCILDLMVMFNDFSTILILLCLNLLI
jgi:hypothetical protein